MKYDFTSILDRRGKDAIAVDAPYVEGCFNHEYFAAATLKEGMDWIPMWVADMNFPTVPTVQKAVVERTAHPAFGGRAPCQNKDGNSDIFPQGTNISGKLSSGRRPETR